MRLCRLLLLAALLGRGRLPARSSVTTPEPKTVGGTIAGIVSTESNARGPGAEGHGGRTRSTGTRYDATTGVNGGYTIKVPQGTYRLEMELRAGRAE